MQNQQGKPGRFMRFVRQKGYYMVLVVCIAAVGISGLYFLRTVMDSPAEELLGEEVSVSIPPKSDALLPEPEAETKEADPEPEQEAETSVPVQPEPKPAAVRPVSGDTV